MSESENSFKKGEWAAGQWSPSDDDDELPAAPRGPNLSLEDRALLELAARALGARFEEVEGEGYGTLHFADGSMVNAWNPLVHKDDAFELMVQLELDIAFMNGDVLVLNVSEGGDDPSARTRRAITRAAAELGKQRADQKVIDSKQAQQ